MFTSYAVIQQFVVDRTNMEGGSIIVSIPHQGQGLTTAEQDCLSALSAAKPVSFKSEIRKEGKGSNVDLNLVGFLELIESSITSHRDLDELSVALRSVIQSCLLPGDFGGMDLTPSVPLSVETEAQIVFLLSTYLEAAKSAERSRHAPKPLKTRPEGRKSMTMAEKIFAAHDVSRKGWVEAGEVVQVDVDWILASELSWAVSTTRAFPAAVTWDTDICHFCYKGHESGV